MPLNIIDLYTEEVRLRNVEHDSLLNGGVRKIPVEIVIEIKKMIRDKVRIPEISRRTQIKETTISNIKYGVCWRHINIEESSE